MKQIKPLQIIILLSLFCQLAVYGTKDQVDDRNTKSGTGYTSIYTERPEDDLAVYFTSDSFAVAPDGSADVSDALQRAIDKVQATVRYGILFIPEGTYKISRTLYIWKGIRLIGYGKNRPVFVLKKNTPGFQEGEGKYLFHFCSDKPHRTGQIQDANSGTFYSGMRNIDIRIESNNQAAIAVRFYVAQHSFLSHINFYLEAGNIGIEDIGNEIEYCRFFGGAYAVKTIKTSPGWQSLIIDSYFEGQKAAAIRTQEAGLMGIRNYFNKVSCVVEINEGFPEELWISDSRFEDVKKPAIIISNINNPRTQVNLKNITCINVPDFVRFRESGNMISPAMKQYVVKTFSHGLQIDSSGGEAEIKTTQEIVPIGNIPSLVPSDVPLLPPMNTWVNLKSLGARGDGITDDTEVIENAIRDHAVIYMPGGHYRVTRPILLRKNTILIGMHPSLTQLVIRDSTRAYQGAGGPLPLLETPRGGTNIVTGIGLNTSGDNPRAVAAKWMSDAHSMMNDVRFTGGHGTYTLCGDPVPVYNDNRTADGIRYRKWDTQYWSLWITDGGGGTFKDIWTPSPYAAAGMRISNTDTEGRVYYMSSEHHVRSEIILDNISNWKFFGLQLEEESGEGPYCLPVSICHSNHLLFANLFTYRVSRITTPFPYAIRTEESNNIVFKGLHNYSWTKFPFENSLYNVSSNLEVRQREIAVLKITDEKPVLKINSKARIVLPEATLEKLADGFDCIDGATCDSQGNLFFVDSKLHHIYRWGTDDRLSLIWDLPMNPVSLACDASDHLMAVTRFVQAPSVHARGIIDVVNFDPDNPEATITTLKEVPFDEIKSKVVIYYQTTRHRNENTLPQALTEKIETGFVSTDGTTVIPNTVDIGQTCSLKKAILGQIFYASTGPGLRTYACQIGDDNSVLSPVLFAETGATDVAVDSKGNVFIPADHIQVYNPEGKRIDTIEVPHRPTNILFGGEDHNTLFICAGSSLYRIRTVNRGR